MRLLVAVAVAGIAAAAVAPLAMGDVDVRTGPKVNAKGSIAPAGDGDTFRTHIAAGSTLSVKVKADAKSSLDPAIELNGPGGPVEIPSDRIVDAGKTVTVKSLPIAQTSRTWTLAVVGTGTGDYALKITVKGAKSAGGTISVEGGGTSTFNFSAEPGSALKVSARAAPGSGAIPRLGTLSSDDGEVDLAGEGKVSATAHLAAAGAPGTHGDYFLDVSNEGATGDVVVSVKIKAPKAKAEKYDVRASALGAAGGGETFLSKTIGAAGGSLSVEGSGATLNGASLGIPAGALADATRISLASAPAPAPPGADDQAAGPAVDLQPSGLQFGVPATLTLPFDPALIPGNGSPEDLRVLVVEDDGTTFEIVPNAINVPNSRLEVSISGFSLCIPVIRSGLPPLGVDPGGDEYWNLTLEYAVDPDPASQDSRSREMLLEVGTTSFFADGSVQSSTSWRTTSWNNAAVPGGIDHGAQSNESGQDYGATWTYGDDGRTIRITEGDGGPVLAASRDGSVLVHWRDIDADDPGEVGWSVMLRKSPPLSAADLKGTWTVGGVEIGLEGAGPGSPAGTDASRTFGTLAFDGVSRATAKIRQRERGVDPATGSLAEEARAETLTATYAVQGDGTILLTFPPHDGDDDDGDVLRVYPGPGGNVMFAADDGPCGPCVFALLLVKQGAGMSPASLDGDYLGSTLSTDLNVYAPTPGAGGTPQNVADPAFELIRFTIPFTGAGTATLDGMTSVTRRESGAGDTDGTLDGVLAGTEPDTFALGVAVDSKGTLTLSPEGEPASVRGAVSPDGMVAFLLRNVDHAGADFLLGLMVRAAPER